MNRRLILLISLFAFIVVTIILSSTVFSLKSAELNFLSTTIRLTNEEQIINSAHFNYGENIFFLNRNAYVESLEQNNPYLKVVNLEVIFPNRIIVHAVERNEFYAFKLKNNTYAITDNELKVLEIRQTFVNTTENAIVVQIFNSQINAESAELGKTLLLGTKNQMLLQEFAKNSLEWDANLANLRGNIKTLTLNYENENNLNIEMRQGIDLIIIKPDDVLSNKLQLAYSVYDSSQVDRTRGILLILKEQSGDVVAMYDAGV